MAPSWSSLWAAVVRFAHARGAVPATFGWNLAQGSVVPGPSELLLAPLVLADPPRGWRLAAAATTGSVLGGCIAWWLGAAAFETIGRPLLGYIGISDTMLARAMALMARHGWLFIIGSVLTPVSAKAVSIGAGAVGMPLPVFALALTTGRALRFSVVVVLLRTSAGVLHRWRLQRFPP
ncbi:MAG: DedA family protein [Gemmatimonadaceae bacterium]|nr:DedA family protein [Gemmatimonadaceae bacterium]